MTQYIRLLFIALLLTLLTPVSAALAADTNAQLEQIRKERAELKQIREQLEARLGVLGQTLKKTDVALVDAGAEARQAQTQVRTADQRINVLKQRQTELLGKMKQLKHHMQREVALAYRQADRPSLSLDMLFDARVADIPHRQYLLARLVEQQQKDREEYAQARQALSVTQGELEDQRQALVSLQVEKEKRQRELQQAQAEKKALWEKVRRDVGLKGERDAQLARQEKALKSLLKGMGSTLLKVDNADDWQSIRKLKGGLSWPINGRIVASFHSRPAPGRARLTGVQLAPRQGGGQVKAIAAGQVRYADWFGGYGLMLIVDHGDGLMTVYAHNDALYKRLGDWVAQGDVLADPGSTGWVPDTRLYFEVRDAGKPVNPRHWCRSKG